MAIFLVSSSTGRADTPDCIYSGRGEVYDFSGNYLKEKSYFVELKRFKSADGSFLFHETKIFADGFKTDLQFSLGWYVGHFSFDDGRGRVVRGQCIDYGYCVGKNEFPNFKGTFVTRFNDKEILTTTTTDTLIIDEVFKIQSRESCPLM